MAFLAWLQHRAEVDKVTAFHSIGPAGALFHEGLDRAVQVHINFTVLKRRKVPLCQSVGRGESCQHRFGDVKSSLKARCLG